MTGQAVVYNVAYTTASAVSSVAYNVAALPVPTATASTTNNNQILLTFNTTIDATAATTLANYTYAGVATLTVAPVLQADNKSVLVTLTGAEAQQAKATLTIANFISTAGVAMPTTTLNVTFLDTTVPTAVSATLVAPTKVDIKFSEPVTATALANTAFALDNNAYSLGIAPVMVAGTVDTIEVTLGSVLPAGAHTLVVNQTGVAAANTIKDFAGFAVPTQTLSFNYATSLVAPTAVVTSVTQKGAVITFSSPVSFAGAGAFGTDLTVYHTFNNQASYAATTYSLAADNKTLTVTFSAPMIPGNVTLYLNNSATATLQLQDGWANKFATTSLSGSLVVDNSMPTITSATKIDASTIDLTFNKAVSGVSTAAFTLKNVAGTATGINSVTNTSGNTYRLALATPMNGDTYTLAALAATIYDGNLTPNYLAAYSTAFVVADATVPTVSGTIIADAAGASGTKIKVSFSKAMATSGAGSILDSNNYVWSTGAFPTGTTFTSTDSGKAVLITFPVATTLVGTTIVTGHVADTFGNFTAALSTGAVAVAADSVVAGNFVTANATSTTSVVVEINEPLSAIDANLFTVNGSAAASATYVNQTLSDGVTNGAVITLSVASGNAWATNATPAVAITAANAVTTAFGTKNGAAVAVSAAAADKTAPGLITTLPIKVTGPNTITITYNEAIFAPSVSIYTYTVAGNTVTNAAVGGATVTLTLGTALVGTDATDLVTQALAIQDASAAHNSLAAISTILTAVDNQAPTVVSAAFIDATHLKIVYSEAVTSVLGDYTPGAVTNGGAGTAATFTTSAISGSGTNTITLTVAGNAALVTGDTAVMAIGAGVVDMAGTPNAITPVVAQAVATF